MIMVMMKNLALFFLFVTVLAPIVLYTEKLGTFTSSSLEDEFREDVSSIRSSNTLNEPIHTDLNNSSSNSVQSYDEIKGLVEDVMELSLLDSTERKTRVLSATDDGKDLQNRNPLKKVTDGVHEGNASNELQEQEVIEERESWEEVKADEQEVKNQISDNVFDKKVSKTNQQSARTYEKADPVDPPKTSTRKGNYQTTIPDGRVRYVKDQLIRAKVYLGLGATRTNPQFIRLLRLRIKELQRALGDATKDSDLPKNASEKLKAMEQILARGKQIQDDYTSLIKRLRAMLHSSEEQLRIHKKQEVFLTQLTAKTLPKGLHCLPLRLSTEYFSLSSSQQQFPYQEKLEDPKLYHYALFSDNVLAAAVVINSTISHVKDSEYHVFHVVTDRLNYAAMRMWFLANPPNKASIQVQNIEDFTWLNSSYSPVLKQLRSRSMMDYYFKVQHSKSDSNLKFRNPKYLSILNHLRFYLPEIFPKLNKVLFLDDDIVVQKDLTSLWSLDLQGKVNGAVETCGESFHRFNRYLNFSNPLISKNFDPHACGWAYGMNIFDLDEWKKQNVTDIYHTWQKLNQDRELWKLGTLPPGLITFWNRTFPLSPSWHVLGLGYNPSVNQKEIEQAAVIHYNGNMKPWLEIGISNYRSYWTKFVDYTQVYLRECNINP